MLSYKRKIGIGDIMSKEGKFELDNFIHTSEHFYTSSIRTGLLDIYKSLSISANEVVLLPPICPQGLVLPLEKLNISHQFYHLKDDFKVDLNDIQSLIERNQVRVVVFIHYFGVFNPQIYDLREICKRNNVLLFEDIVHGFLGKDDKGNNIGNVGDLSFCSLPKFFSTPDGALFFFNNINYVNTFDKRKSILHSFSVFFHSLSLLINSLYPKTSVKILRKLLKTTSQGFYFLYYSSLNLMSKNTDMSSISKKILSNIDYEEFINKKRFLFKFFNKNFMLYDDNLFSIPPGYPIIDPSIDYNNIKKILSDNNIEVLTYIKAWDYIPNNENFDYERKLLHGHILLPLDIENSDKYNDDLLDLIDKCFNE